MKLPAYPRYKSSGVEWLGDVPEHWDTQGVKFCYSIQLGKMLQPEPSNPTDEETPYLKSQHVQWEHVRVADLPTMWTTKTERSQYAVAGGDLLVCEGGDVGRAAVVHGAPAGTIIQNALHRVRPLGVNDVGFLLYVLAHAASQGWFEIICNKSTIAHFTVDKFGALGVALPSPAEQRAIAAFLDRETGRIDRLVAKKRELIERLKEKRTALISRTVTHGLNAAVAFKPSGIDWLGDIPEHWEVRKFSREVAIAEGQVDPEKEPYASMLLIGPEHVESATGRLLQRATAADQAAESGKYFSRKGDVIYSKIRPALKKLVKAPEDCLCSADMYPLRARTRLDNRFIFWLFLSKQFSGWSVLESDRVAMPKINRDTLNELRMPVPPLPEQASIAAYLDAETAKLDALVAKVEEAIERLQEYRTALITAAVTGKIDVRNAVK